MYNMKVFKNGVKLLKDFNKEQSKNRKNFDKNLPQNNKAYLKMINYMQKLLKI